MKLYDLTVVIGGVECTFGEVDIDFDGLDRVDQTELLEAILTTMPDPDIAKTIDKHGTQDLCMLITPWVLENNTEVVEKSEQEVTDDKQEIQP